MPGTRELNGWEEGNGRTGGPSVFSRSTCGLGFMPPPHFLPEVPACFFLLHILIERESYKNGRKVEGILYIFIYSTYIQCIRSEISPPGLSFNGSNETAVITCCKESCGTLEAGRFYLALTSMDGCSFVAFDEVF